MSHFDNPTPEQTARLWKALAAVEPAAVQAVAEQQPDDIERRLAAAIGGTWYEVLAWNDDGRGAELVALFRAADEASALDVYDVLDTTPWTHSTLSQVGDTTPVVGTATDLTGGVTR